MSTTVPTCPHCGAGVSANDEFCPSCSAWLVGGATWPAPPKPIPQPVLPPTGDEDEPEPVPLVIPDTSPILHQLARIRIALLALTVVMAGIWLLAERMIVTRQAWAGWDYIWVVAAALTLLALGWWVRDLVRRGRTNGWHRWWRFWEQPGDSLTLF